MPLSWKLSNTGNPFATVDQFADGCRFHFAESMAVDDRAVKDDLEEAMEQAIVLLDANVKNESRYFMVEWDLLHSILRLAVTNDARSEDAEDVVALKFSALNEQLQTEGEAEIDSCSEKVQFWAKDFLSTCTGFMDYSLVAVFTDSTRDKVKML